MGGVIHALHDTSGPLPTPFGVNVIYGGKPGIGDVLSSLAFTSS